MGSEIGTGAMSHGDQQRPGSCVAGLRVRLGIRRHALVTRSGPRNCRSQGLAGSTTALLSLSDAVIPDGPQVTEPSERPALVERTHSEFQSRC